jgi:hypothetical protein
VNIRDEIDASDAMAAQAHARLGSLRSIRARGSGMTRVPTGNSEARHKNRR